MTRTTCPYCGVGCGVKAGGAREAMQVSGDETHPANTGRLCSKGSALGETVRLDGRLLHPMVGDRPTNWAHATHVVARRFAEIVEQHGPDAVAFYVSGQLLTEDYYVANKLMKGFIGSGNIDTNSRLCMASAVAAQKLAFGEDVVPGCYDDLDLADLIIFCGHNAAWTHPVLYRRMEPALAHGQRHIVIDPRETDTARQAWLHLKLKSQTDVRLWNGLLAHLWETGAADRRYIVNHTAGLHDTLAALARDDQSIPAIALDCGLEADEVSDFYLAFARTSKTVTLFSQGANQSTQGVAKGLAIINAHLITGRVSKAGASPFSITGQPNAMGGRETGGMANTLAAHMDFAADEVDRVARFWNAPNIASGPGLKAVEMFDAVGDGRIRAIWIMATNPAVSMPDSSRVRAALAACPFVVVSDVIAETDTSAFAHVRLPALAWGEKDGTVTNSERCISRQRAVLPAPGEARADWRIIADVAAAMGFEYSFAYRSAAHVFREYAALTHFENGGERRLDLGPLACLSDDAYASLAPVRWPIAPDGAGTDRPFSTGSFSTPDGRARFHSAAVLAAASATDFPLVLNTGRLRDQWHTMTRTGLSARLMRHAPEPCVDVHPQEANAFGLVDGMLAEIETPHGRATLMARVTETVRPGEIFAPMHWTDDFAPHARANALVNPDVDPVSGQPAFKQTPARIAPLSPAWRGFMATRARKDPPRELWWRRIPQDVGQLYEIAAPPDVSSPAALAEFLFDDLAPEEWIEAGDGAGAFFRRAALRNDRLERALFITRGRGLPARDWLVAQLAAERIDDDNRRLLLAGGAGGTARSGPSVCACFNISRREIEALAVAEPDLTIARVGMVLKAGSNCGSCRLEIAQILAATKEQSHVAV
ncbi:MAG: nitrate reductase catalytic subunit [Caulobacteraceae bacterium]|nr:MAG: nitrate reductase catalytic subunit [Caulobacteraceae bacterium]